jgi:hypothetical protein
LRIAPGQPRLNRCSDMYSGIIDNYALAHHAFSNGCHGLGIGMPPSAWGPGRGVARRHARVCSACGLVLLVVPSLSTTPKPQLHAGPSIGDGRRPAPAPAAAYDQLLN